MAAALKTLVERLEDDGVSDSSEDGTATIAATGALDCKTASDGVVGAAEEQMAEMAKRTVWSFIFSKKTSVQGKCVRKFDAKSRQLVYQLTKGRNADFGCKLVGKRSEKTPGGPDYIAWTKDPRQTKADKTSV